MTIADSGFMMEAGASCLPCTPEEEKRIVTDLMRMAESNLKEGNLYYVISNRYSGYFFQICPMRIVSTRFPLHAALTILNHAFCDE